MDLEKIIEKTTVSDDDSSSFIVSFVLLANGHENLQQQLDVKLDETARLLVQLRQAQYERLCQPSNKIHQLINGQAQQNNEPTNEVELAEKVLNNLSEMIHSAPTGPSQVITSSSIHHSLGISPNPESILQPISDTS